MAEHGGAIVNVASVGGLRPGIGLGIYNVTKAGVIMLTRQLANARSDAATNAGRLESNLADLRARAAELQAKPKLVDEALASGTAACSTIARKTISEVRDRMGF